MLYLYVNFVFEKKVLKGVIFFKMNVIKGVNIFSYLLYWVNIVYMKIVNKDYKFLFL